MDEKDIAALRRLHEVHGQRIEALRQALDALRLAHEVLGATLKEGAK